jgi:hypothetical protein
MIYFLLFFLFFLLFTLLLLSWQKKEKENFQLSWDSKSPSHWDGSSAPNATALRSHQINDTRYKLDSDTFYHILDGFDYSDITLYSEDPRSG